MDFETFVDLWPVQISPLLPIVDRPYAYLFDIFLGNDVAPVKHHLKDDYMWFFKTKYILSSMEFTKS